MPISIKFCGGVGTVTGSMHLVSTGKSQVLLDCGLFQGHREEFYSINSNFPFNPQSLDACVLSHAHIDHCGNLPTLIKRGYRSSIYSTPATRDLCRYMLPDSGYVQQEDIKYVNKINRRKGLPSRRPLYIKKEAEQSLKYFRPVEYHKSFALSSDVVLTFFDAGHILGSAISVLDVKTHRGVVRIGYATDLGRYGMPLLRDPEVPKGMDYLIIESTYGGRKHGSIKDVEKNLADTINRTVKRGGKIIIPSFALERTQLIVFFISELMKKGKIKKIPIYVDSPLAVNLTQVFRQNWMYFDDITREAFSKKEDPLGYGNITYVTKVNDSKRLNSDTRPMIIISASGMCENGRILHHLKNNIENPNNTILIVGFMARNTLGRRIVEGNKLVRIFGRVCKLKAEVAVFDAFSSHADETGLLEYVVSGKERLKQIFIVHGEKEQSEALKRRLKRLNLKVSIPSKGEQVLLKPR
ncbi:MAG: MBL fold metallo-hydrolase [Candidatus Omnitrophota bacterium]